MVDVSAQSSPFVLLQHYHLVLLVITRLHDEHHDYRDTAHNPTYLFKNAHEVISNTIIGKLFSLEQKVPVQHQVGMSLICCINTSFLYPLVSFGPFEDIEILRLINDTEEIILEFKQRLLEQEFSAFEQVLHSLG